MKKKIVSALMCTALVASMLVGCGSGETNPPADASDASDAAATDDAAGDTAEADDTEDAAEDEAETAEAEAVTNTFGDPNGTHLEMWTFVELHGQHYGKMAADWNTAHPDNTIEITCTTYPYADMHTKLLTAL